MTTNIFDGNALVMATDSRWSIKQGSWLFYLDDTGYDKIERLNGVAVMFAGEGPKIQEYKNWIHSKPNDLSNMPEVKGMSVCMVDESTGCVDFQKHQDIEENNVFCAGTGAQSAYICWLEKKCSQTAVESAKLKDYYSGGDVKYIDFKTLKTNLAKYFPEQQLTIETISANIMKRGPAMKIHANPTGIPDLPLMKASSDASFDEQDARQRGTELVASGQLSATAPCNGMHSDWSENDKEGFKQALGKMFGWNN